MEFEWKIFSGLGPGSEKKWYRTYDCKPDGWISDIPWYQCLGDRRNNKQGKWKEVNTLQRQYAEH